MWLAVMSDAAGLVVATDRAMKIAGGEARGEVRASCGLRRVIAASFARWSTQPLSGGLRRGIEGYVALLSDAPDMVTPGRQ